MMTKLTFLTACFIFSLQSLYAQIKVEKPNISNDKKAFAIIIDSETYNQTVDAVKAYQKTIEADGLATYIVSGAFLRPDDVKKEIVKLHKTKQSIEGIVLVGEIPIPMIRNAQHLSTAFKMNEEKYSWERSSVPSDRFYDDLSLTFEYLKQDPDRPLLHYYKLLEESPQYLKPSIYSARIRYPSKNKNASYQAITDYLHKVTSAKRDQILDHFVAFTGAGYNSDCLVAWKDDLKLYKETFPYLGNSVNSLKQLHYSMNDFMKFQLFDEMQRKDVDVLLMRHHGTPTTELINTTPQGLSLQSRIAALRRDLYSQVRHASAKKQDVDSLKNILKKQYYLNDDYFTDLNNPETIRLDSITEANTFISAQDLRGIRTQPQFIILDACYNASFDQDDYVASRYLFNPGNTIAVQGNTRNVLQDKWSMEQMGLLSYGVRLGHIQNLQITLEGHLMGDPTFHFGTKDSEKLNEKISGNPANNYWTELLKKEDPLYQCLALRKIADHNVNFSSTLLKYISTSPYRSVRLEALKLISAYNNEDFVNAVKIALTDEYEMIARQGAIYAGKIGDNKLIPSLAYIWANDKTRKRVQFNIASSISSFNKSEIESALIAELKKSNRLDKDEEIKALQATFAKSEKSQSELSTLTDKSADITARINSVRSIRNNNYHENIQLYLGILKDKKESTELRVAIAEALGWFVYSKDKQLILSSCQEIFKSRVPKEVKTELQQTINRLSI